MTDRGQSELIGFLFVFVLVLATMSLITAASLGELRGVRDAEQMNNAERAFEILAENVDDIVREGASSQATEVNLAGGRLSFGDPVTVTVNGTETALGSDANFSYEYSVQPIVYESDSGTRIIYAGGATIRQDRSGSAMLTEPPLVLSEERSNVLVVETRQAGQLSAVAGSSTALVRTERATADHLQANATTYDLTIEVGSPRAGVWARYLSDQPGVDCDSPTGGSVSCSLTTHRVHVAVVRIDVLLE